jgi:hypothetical protein
MALRQWCQQVAAVALAAGLGAGCTASPDLTAPQVFVGRFENVSFQPFLHTLGSDVSVDSRETREGRNTLRITVPDPGHPDNWYAGGAFTASLPRDLSGYDAVTFWARATREGVMLAGLGNDNSGGSLYGAAWGGVSLTTTWQKFVVPIPLPAKLASERGLFYFSAGATGSPPMGYTLWLSDIQYEKLGSTVIGPVRPFFEAASVPAPGSTLGLGATFAAFPLGDLATMGDATRVIIPVNGKDQVIILSHRYLDYASADPTVATVSVDGVVTTVGAGTTTLTASLGGRPAAGDLTVTVTTPVLFGPAPSPPARDPANVVSIYSDAYANVPVDPGAWRFFGNGDNNPAVPSVSVSDVSLAGNAAKKYTNLSYVGIATFMAQTVDASQMGFFHIDVWTPDALQFAVDLVDMPSGEPGGAGQSEGKVTFGTTATPFPTGQWVSLDIPMASFVAAGLSQRSHIGYVVLVAPASGQFVTAYVDNLYFHK